MSATLKLTVLLDYPNPELVDREKFQHLLIETKDLKLISSVGETLTIDACDGTEILADAKDVFNYIDSDFRNWGADEPGQATEETPVAVYEIMKNGTYEEFFNLLNPKMEKLSFTQAQIKGFVKKHRKWLCRDYGTFFSFFSFKSNFVANVNFNSDGKLKVYVFEFENDNVWNADDRHRVVVPQRAVAT